METAGTTQPNSGGSASPQLNLIIIGPPGSGKGSQCHYLTTKYGLVHISSGDLLRKEKTSGTLVGQFLVGNWNVQKVAGITFELLEREIKRIVTSGKNFVIDGSPRTASEAKRIIRFLANEGIGISAVIEFTVKEDQAVHRVNTRLVHPASGRVYNLDTCPPKVPGKDDVTGEPLLSRDDDGDVAMHNRFRSWEKYGPELVEFLKSDASGKPPYYEIDANKSLAEVNANLSELVERIRGQPLTTFDAFKGEDTDPKHKTNPVLGGTMASAMERACVQQQIHNMTQSKKSATHFPGTHPVSMTKSTLHQLVEEDHRVARKIDGQRRLLLIMNERCYLVDRKMFAETFPTPIDSKFNLTLFDGEIVKTTSKKEGDAADEWHFVIFDVIAVSNNYCGKSPLFDRLTAGKAVLEALKDLPFKLEFQDYLPLDQLPVALGKSETTSSKYELDGLIFIPIHCPYRLGFCQQLLKWKPEKENTIDCSLQDLKVGDKTYWQLNVGQEGEVAFYDWIDLSEEDITAHSLADGDIVECYWDRNFVPKLPPQELLADYEVFAWSEARAPATGGWRVHRKRTDKDKPNADWVVVKIEQSIVESLTEKDLLSFVALKADVIEKLKTEEHTPRRSGGRYREKEGWDNRRGGGQGQGSRQYNDRDRHDNRGNYGDRRQQYNDRDNRHDNRQGGRQDRHQDNRQEGGERRGYGNRYNGHHHGENGQSGGHHHQHGNRYDRYQSKGSYPHGSGDSHHQVAGSPPKSSEGDDGRWRRGDQTAITERSNYEKARRDSRDHQEGSQRTSGGASSAPRGNQRQDNRSEGPRPTPHHQPAQPIRGSYAQALGGSSSPSSEPAAPRSQPQASPKQATQPAPATPPQTQAQPVPVPQQQPQAKPAQTQTQAPAPAAPEGGGWAAVAKRGLPTTSTVPPQQQQQAPQQAKGGQQQPKQQQQGKGQQQQQGKRQGGQGRAGSRS